MRIRPFSANRTIDLDPRFRAIENFLSDLSTALSPAATRGTVQGITEPSAGTSEDATSSGGGGTSVTTIDESQVIFDPDEGHAHDGDEGGHSIGLAGDTSGTNLASTVDKLKNVPLSGAPVAGDANRFIKYSHASVQFQYSSVGMAGDASGNNEAVVVDKIKTAALPAAPGASQNGQVLRWNNGGAIYEFANFTGLTVLGTWAKADASTLGAADADIDNAWAGAAGVTLANPMVRAGALVGITLKATADVGAATQDVIGTCYKNGVATTITATITGGAGTEDEAVATFTPVTFAAGDDIKVMMKHSGVAPAAVRVVAIVLGFYN